MEVFYNNIMRTIIPVVKTLRIIKKKLEVSSTII